MSSLILASRTRVFPVFRIGGSLVAGVASVGWIAERMLGLPNFVDVAAEAVAAHAGWIAASLFVASLACWLVEQARRRQAAWFGRLPGRRSLEVRVILVLAVVQFISAQIVLFAFLSQ